MSRQKKKKINLPPMPWHGMMDEEGNYVIVSNATREECEAWEMLFSAHFRSFNFTRQEQAEVDGAKKVINELRRRRSRRQS